MNKRRILPLILLVAGVAIALLLGRSAPKDQMVHFALGEAAPRVVELRVRYGDRDEWLREARFHWDPGKAPKIVTHEPRLADGTYTVEVEVTATTGEATVKRDVSLEGGSTTIDVSRSVPKER